MRYASLPRWIERKAASEPEKKAERTAGRKDPV